MNEVERIWLTKIWNHFLRSKWKNITKKEKAIWICLDNKTLSPLKEQDKCSKYFKNVNTKPAFWKSYLESIAWDQKEWGQFFHSGLNVSNHFSFSAIALFYFSFYPFFSLWKSVVWFCFFITKRWSKTMPLWCHFACSCFLVGREENINARWVPYLWLNKRGGEEGKNASALG